MQGKPFAASCLPPAANSLVKYRIRRFPKRHRLVSVPSLTESGKCGLMVAQ
jgi:hypothetical protein